MKARCSRVLVNAEGSALPTQMAYTRYRLKPDIIFFRADGWSLGAPEALEEHAYRLWKDLWISFMRKGDGELKPISDYQPKET